MKQPIAFLTALLMATLVQAQSPLLRSQVFDFDIGDEFQMQIDGMWGPPTYVLNVITGRTPIGTDSVLYQMDQSSVIYNNNMTITSVPPAPTTITYDRLNDTANRPFLNTGINETSTFSTYQDSSLNLRQVNELELENTAPLSAGISNTIWGEGLGLVYFNALAPGDGVYEFYTLRYYKKGTEIYGGLITDVPEPEPASIHLYPNPVETTVRVELSEHFHASEVTYQVVDLQGRILQQGQLPENHSLDLSGLASGHYWLKLQAQGSETGTRIFKR